MTEPLTDTVSAATLTRLSGTAQLSLSTPQWVSQQFVSHEPIESSEDCYQFVVESEGRDCIVSVFKDCYSVSGPPKHVSTVHQYVEDTLSKNSVLDVDIGEFRISDGAFRATPRLIRCIRQNSERELEGKGIQHETAGVRVIVKPDVQIGSVIFLEGSGEVEAGERFNAYIKEIFADKSLNRDTKTR